MRLNVENATKLRDFLRRLPEDKFDHGYWNSAVGFEEGEELIVEGKNVCGTTGCIGGWAVILGNLSPWKVNEAHQITFDDVHLVQFSHLAGDWLGLETTHERATLFYPWDVNLFYQLSDLNPDMDDYAVEALATEYREYVFDELTTNAESAAFLDRIIAEDKIDFRWWKDIKSARLDAE